jgi:hypothetical protein
MDRAPRTTVALALLVIAGVLAACGQAGSAANQEDPAFQPVGEGLDEAVSRGGEDLADEGAGGPPGENLDAAPIEQRIIKTGEVTLEVSSVAAATGSIRAMATELGGYVGGSQAGGESESATLTLRVPAASFDDALARLHDMDAQILAEATREQDVTAQVVDLRARIANLEASEESYRELVARAEKVEDILAVQTRLDAVRGEIEQMQAQLDNVSAQADLSTLTVTLVPRSAPVEEQTQGWDPGGDFNEALASLVGMGQGLVSALIWLAIVWVPLIAVLVLLTVVVWRGSLEVRRRLPRPVQPIPTEDRS